MRPLTHPEALLCRLAAYSETLDPRGPTSEPSSHPQLSLGQFRRCVHFRRWPYGYGIGAVSLGGQYVTRIMHVPPSIIIEMGIVGLLLWFVMAGAVLICSWWVVRRLRGSAWFPLTFMISGISSCCCCRLLL
jgi:hypothetical protein